MNSFGGKDGFGVYQVVEDVVMKYDKETVMPHALKALNNESENVKYWCIQIISHFPDNRLFKPLVELLELEDEDIKAATITALAQLALNNLCVNEVIKVLEDETERITDEDIKNSNCAEGKVRAATIEEIKALGWDKYIVNTEE